MYFPSESKTSGNRNYYQRDLYNLKTPSFNFLPELRKTYSTDENNTSILIPFLY